MFPSLEPNPPSRKPGDFPKTNTIPEGWMVDPFVTLYALTFSAYHSGAPRQENWDLPMTGAASFRPNGKAHAMEPDDCPAAAPDTDDLFTRRLEPFPSAWDLLFGMLL